jgi:effector-binding domain-containing protein
MPEIEQITTQRQLTVSIQTKVKIEDIPSYMGKAYGELFVFIQAKGLVLMGPPMVYYNSWNDKEVDMTLGFPVAGPFHAEGMFKAFELPSVKAVTIVHVGPYQTLMQSYMAIEQWMKEKGLVPAQFMWEEYLNDPSEVSPQELRTKITWPIKE